MTDEHDQPARPEQPGRGGFEEGQQTLPGNEHVGQFSDGVETLPDNHHVGQFSDGNEKLPDNQREGQFSDSVEPDDLSPLGEDEPNAPASDQATSKDTHTKEPF